MQDLVIGIDVGGTKIAAGLIDRNARFIARDISHSHCCCPPDQVVDEAVKMVQRLLSSSAVDRSRILGVGVGISGHIDGDRGIVMTNSNLPDWDYYPLRDTLKARLGFPVMVDNDANCAAWGEYRHGAGRGSQNMCYVTFSTGCGMGIVINGSLYRGACGTAGEIGHTVVNPDGSICSCGKRGCLMSYACGMALDQMARDCLKTSEDTLLRSVCGDSPDKVTAEHVADAARQGDRVALRLLEQAGRYFGIGLSTIVQVLNPDTIVIGGGLVHIGPLLLDPCIKALNENIHHVLIDSARIVQSELWNDAGVIGAGALIWEAKQEGAVKPQIELTKGMVFDIQRYSLHDGPGLRTNVFLKGCNLSCQWCSNPESRSILPELAFFDKNCFLCGDCIPVCAAGGIQMKAGRLNWDRSKCNQCFDCVDACTAHAFSLIGKSMTAGEVVAEVLRDSAFYGEQGGLTLTGGEPALQPEFAEAVLSLAKAEGLHTAIETCGAVPWKNLVRLLPYLDLALFDLKHIDAETHRRFTGKDNKGILENLTRVAQSDVDLIVRVPLIPGFNANDASLEAIAEFVKTLKRVKELHVLGFHTLGRPKYHAIGIDYPFENQPPMKIDETEKWADVFRREGLNVVVSG